MKKLFTILTAAFVTFVAAGLTVGEAEARRLGGGSSFGMQRQSVAPKPAPSRQATPAAPASPTQATPKRNWMGPIAGLAAGLGLAALASYLGFGEGLANFLMIALLAFAAIFLVRMFLRKQGPAQSSPMQYAGMGRHDAPPGMPQQSSGGASAVAGSPSIPADFDSESFLRVAKLNFVRLQTANDDRNLDDIREFVSPEVFAEIKMQMDERGSAAQKTEVVTLDAELLEVVTEGNRHIASVHFNGMIREIEGAAAVPFGEVWHLAKPVDGSKGWSIAGIQQVS